MLFHLAVPYLRGHRRRVKDGTLPARGLQERKPSVRESESLAQGHTVGEGEAGTQMQLRLTLKLSDGKLC